MHLNDEGPQTKYHKFHDQNPQHFDNIGAMKGGGVMNEEESLYSDNESIDIEAIDKWHQYEYHLLLFYR